MYVFQRSSISLRPIDLLKKEWFIVNFNEWALTNQDIGPINGSRVKIRGHMITQVT